jgi:hypothetical protein
MKTTMKTMLALIALSASALIVNAQDAGGPPPGGNPPYRQGGPGGPGGPGGRHMPPSPLIEALDANHDGVIDANEIANAAAALKTLDKNGDGQLTPDELRPQGGDHQGPPPGAPGSGPRRMPPSPLMGALDANHDGVIDATEIANAPAALKALDKNGDGKLTMDELRPPRPQGGDHQGPPPGPDGQPPQHPPSDN